MLAVEPSLLIRAGEEAGGAKGARLTTLLRVGSAELKMMDALSAAWTMSLFIPCKLACQWSANNVCRHSTLAPAYAYVHTYMHTYANMYIWTIHVGIHVGMHIVAHRHICMVIGIEAQ